MIIYVIIAIVFFGILVGIHEFGHFAVAKLCGIRVEEFAIGMGPAIFQKKKGETLYSLRCIPFGGYCAMTGEDGESEDPRAFVNQKVWKRFLVLVAGAFMNFLLGFIIVLCLFAGAEGYAVPSIVSFMDGCPYESAEGFQAGDWIMKIDGHRVYSTADVTARLREDTPQTFLLILNGEYGNAVCVSHLEDALASASAMNTINQRLATTSATAGMRPWALSKWSGRAWACSSAARRR